MDVDDSSVRATEQFNVAQLDAELRRRCQDDVGHTIVAASLMPTVSEDATASGGAAAPADHGGATGTTAEAAAAVTDADRPDAASTGSMGWSPVPYQPLAAVVSAGTGPNSAQAPPIDREDPRCQLRPGGTGVAPCARIGYRVRRRGRGPARPANGADRGARLHQRQQGRQGAAQGDRPAARHQRYGPSNHVLRRGHQDGGRRRHGRRQRHAVRQCGRRPLRAAVLLRGGDCPGRHGRGHRHRPSRWRGVGRRHHAGLAHRHVRLPRRRRPQGACRPAGAPSGRRRERSQQPKYGAAASAPYAQYFTTASGASIERPFGPKFRSGDVIGCGFVGNGANDIFFTRNGTYLGVGACLQRTGRRAFCSG